MALLNLVVIVCLSSIVSPLLAEGGNFENTPAPIGIYISFDGPHSDRAVAAMQREVEGLTKASGFRLQWRSLENRSSEDKFSDLMVIKLRGSCNMQGIQLLFSELGPDADSGAALGSTKTSDGQVLPFSELYCDRIRRSIAPLSIGASPEDRESLLGRAMGRVLAHELFHVFANTDKHGHEGVAKTAYSRKDLVADGFTFDAKDAKRMERTATRP
jgi:hypothetical protein